MTPPRAPFSLDSAAKDALILEQAALIRLQTEQIARLTARVAELEARLGQPPKTPDNSSTPPSSARKGAVETGDTPSGGKRRCKGRKGHHRALHANPTRILDLKVSHCPCCAADVARESQWLCEAYDNIEMPLIEPLVTRINLYGGACPNCAKPFKASPPQDMLPGSPFGTGLRALVLYLRYTQGIAFKRLSRLLADCFGLLISEGALINMVAKAAESFSDQFERIRQRLLSSSVLASDETGLRIGGRNGWLWVVHHGDSAGFVADLSRAKRVLEDFLGKCRPQFWLSDRYGAQKGFASREHQYCLAHLIRDAQYAADAGDSCFAPALINLLKRACRIGRKRDQLTDRQLEFYRRKWVKKLSELLALKPTHDEGSKLQTTIGKIRRNLFVFMTDRTLEPTNNGSEQALRPAVTFRKITNGFRTLWGASFYAHIRSVIETARRRGINPLLAIRLTIAGTPMPLKSA